MTAPIPEPASPATATAIAIAQHLTNTLNEAVKARHSELHAGPFYVCTDPICAALVAILTWVR